MWKAERHVRRANQEGESRKIIDASHQNDGTIRSVSAEARVPIPKPPRQCAARERDGDTVGELGDLNPYLVEYVDVAWIDVQKLEGI